MIAHSWDYCQGLTTSAAGTRTRVARVRAEYPNQIDYSGCWYDCPFLGLLSGADNLRHRLLSEGLTTSATGTRTRVARLRAEYPNQLDYSGYWYNCPFLGLPSARAPSSRKPCASHFQVLRSWCETSRIQRRSLAGQSWAFRWFPLRLTYLDVTWKPAPS